MDNRQPVVRAYCLVDARFQQLLRQMRLTSEWDNWTFIVKQIVGQITRMLPPTHADGDVEQSKKSTSMQGYFLDGNYYFHEDKT